MKKCTTCQESFADKFAFCPVDGTPLNGHVPSVAAVDTSSRVIESKASDPEASTFTREAKTYETVASETVSSNGHEEETVSANSIPHSGAISEDGREEYHLTILEDRGLTARLIEEVRTVAHESQLTWPEFKRDPLGFSRRTITAYGALAWRTFSQRNVALATLSAFIAMFVIIGAVVAMDRRNQRKQAERVAIVEDLEVQQWVEVPNSQPTPEPAKKEGAPGMAKGTGGGSKPKPERASGGGGGGRQETKPASYGKLPPAVMQPQILPPNPHPPTVKNPSLPMTPTIQADPALFPPDNRQIAYGDPKSRSLETSSGPGTGGGIGTGSRGGVGSGEGGGVGPGRGGNTGGGDANYGGGGPGGGGTGPFKPSEVTQKAVLLSKPEPAFTEEARKNNVTGTVKLRMALLANGGVGNISVVKGLPDGLTEKAIAAAKQIKFQPARINGQPVAQWVVIEYSFNIY